MRRDCRNRLHVQSHIICAFFVIVGRIADTQVLLILCIEICDLARAGEAQTKNIELGPSNVTLRSKLVANWSHTLCYHIVTYSLLPHCVHHASVDITLPLSNGHTKITSGVTFRRHASCVSTKHCRHIHGTHFQAAQCSLHCRRSPHWSFGLVSDLTWLPNTHLIVTSAVTGTWKKKDTICF
jgi:hypothetical protein